MSMQAVLAGMERKACLTGRDTCQIDSDGQVKSGALNQVCNAAVSDRSVLNALYGMMKTLLSGNFVHAAAHTPAYVGFRQGDVRHSQAEMPRAATLSGYVPTHRIDDGLREAMDWTVHDVASGTEDHPMFSK